MYKQTEGNLEATMKEDWEALKKFIKDNKLTISVKPDTEVEKNSPQLDWNWCKRPYFSK